MFVFKIAMVSLRVKAVLGFSLLFIGGYIHWRSLIVFEPKLKFFGVATKEHEMLKINMLNFESKGQELIVLGLSENRSIGFSHPKFYGAFGFKLQATRDFIYSDSHSPDDVLVMIDAYDVYLSGEPMELLSKYVTFTKPVVFAAEAHCFPDRHAVYPKSDLEFEFPYLNSGVFMGKVSALRELMIETDFPEKSDDQRYWTKKYLARPDLIELDHKNLLFFCFNAIDRHFLSYKDDQVFYRDAKPVLVHANGGSKGSLRPLKKFAKTKFDL